MQLGTHTRRHTRTTFSRIHTPQTHSSTFKITIIDHKITMCTPSMSKFITSCNKSETDGYTHVVGQWCGPGDRAQNGFIPGKYGGRSSELNGCNCKPGLVRIYGSQITTYYTHIYNFIIRPTCCHIYIQAQTLTCRAVKSQREELQSDIVFSCKYM
jgi:hypothetical protein